MPILPSLDEGRIVIADGGTLRTPALTSFTRSNVELNPARTWIRPTITQMDGSLVWVTGGAQFTSTDT